MDPRVREVSVQSFVDTIYTESLSLGPHLVDLQPGALKAQMDILHDLDYTLVESRLCPLIVS